MILQKIKNIYWNNKLLSDEQKSNVYYKIQKLLRVNSGGKLSTKNKDKVLEAYCKQVLAIPTDRDKKYYKSLTTHPYRRVSQDPKIIAYYLPQFHENPENNAWWGKGTTEWNNVGRAVPQYLGHYQPRQPGELGYYDLRVKDVLVRQCELAKMYGIFGFAWYFYSFDGKSLLRRPLDMFLNSPDIDFPFCLCWANESWTRSFVGSSKEVVMKQNDSIESYKSFIQDAARYLKDSRYITIEGKKLLIVYKPLDIPGGEEVVSFWRKYCLKNGIGDLYVIGNFFQSMRMEDYQGKGLDALGEFQIGSIVNNCKIINDQKDFVSNSFVGKVYDYRSLVEEQVYKINFDKYKMYNAIFPMWDNTPRRNNKDNIIFDGATPDLYKHWLHDIIENNRKRTDLDENLIFLNSWNEWGEGSYIEPDKRYGYAFLDATKETIENSRT